MKLENNIIKNCLKNVYFISGNACGGKSTMTKLLSEKYGFYLYNMDEQYSSHRSIAIESNQPNMCYHGKDFHEQWMRPIEEQAHWMINSLSEQTEMVITDLIRISQNKIVVADVLFCTDYLDGIVDPDKIIFLTVKEDLIREIYFDRPDKRSFYEFVNSQELAQTYFENIFQSLEMINLIEKEYINKTNFFSIERSETSTVEDTFEIIEKHFKLI